LEGWYILLACWISWKGCRVGQSRPRHSPEGGFKAVNQQPKQSINTQNRAKDIQLHCTTEIWLLEHFRVFHMHFYHWSLQLMIAFYCLCLVVQIYKYYWNYFLNWHYNLYYYCNNYLYHITASYHQGYIS